MKFNLIRAGVVAIALLATPFAAVAADIRPPVYKGAPRSVIAYYNWTGFYAGLYAGYGWGESTWDIVGVDTSPKGWLAGGTVGYNWQTGSFVWGLEGDIGATGVKGTAVCAAIATCETSNRWLATFRGRVGYAFDRFMPYFTGGGAYGDIKSTVGMGPVALTASTTRFGWTAGGGLEYAFLSNWTTKLEYLYVDLGSFDPGFVVPVGNVDFKEHVVRLGVNYKFGPRW